MRRHISPTPDPAGAIHTAPPVVCAPDRRTRNGRRLARILLLAPSGTPEAMAAALHAGADAVYVGLQGWSRGAARNEFTEQQLRAALPYAHRLHRRVYLAANTIPRREALPQLMEQLRRLAGCGLDGVIVNDPGLLRAIRQTLPQLPLTASVGCGALNGDDVLFYASLGATAVVLPGNLEPAEIVAIRARSSMPLEIMLHMVQEFVQLGKCWIPSYHHFPAATQVRQRLTGSVKRGGLGACFKICQQPWQLLRDGHLVDQRVLPGRQLSRLSELGEYLEAGIDIIKIQGRSLSPEQLVPLVDRYRSAIDAWRHSRKIEGSANVLPSQWTIRGR